MLIIMKLLFDWIGLSSLAQQDVKEDVESFAEEKFEDKMDDLLSR